MIGHYKFNLLLISDFNIDMLGRYLDNDDGQPEVKTDSAPFGQIVPVLMDKENVYWKKKYDCVVVWARPESVIGSFRKVLNYEHVPIENLLEEVDEYSRALLNIQERVNLIFVPAWVIPSFHRGYGMLEMKEKVGITNILMRMNLKLAENISGLPNICLLNTQKWIELSTEDAFNPKSWYLGKMPFGNEVFLESMKDIKAALNAISGNAKKLIILDLDDTLWGGIVGDVGWKDITLGGHDHIGEAYLDFQKALKSLKNRGILLGIVSKNEESVALEAIDKHPEMALKIDDFAGWRINWQDKANNIVELTQDLNLGLQSVVFIDDNKVERARVREALPEVLVPEWPEDNMLCTKMLLGLKCFDAPVITNEDLERSRMYASNRERHELKKKIPSLDEWLKTLGTKVKIEELSEINIQRAAQLLNKTNQMNLTTRRLTEKELLNWASCNDRKLWVFRVSDKFGDSGLTGIVSVEVGEKKGRIIDFVLSCRVMGRKIEETMLWKTIEYAKIAGLENICAKYIETQKNKPCLDFLKRSGFIYDETGNIFIWETKSNYHFPECVQLQK